jgi:hypothetical protein
MILLYGCELSLHPMKDVKFKNFRLHFKIIKGWVCHIIHSLVLVIDKYR